MAVDSSHVHVAVDAEVDKESAFGIPPEARTMFMGFLVLEVPFERLNEFKVEVAKKLLGAGTRGGGVPLLCPRPPAPQGPAAPCSHEERLW